MGQSGLLDTEATARAAVRPVAYRLVSWPERERRCGRRCG